MSVKATMTSKGQIRRAGRLTLCEIVYAEVAAHASVQADALAAADRGYLRRYFPGLRLPAPA